MVFLQTGYEDFLTGKTKKSDCSPLFYGELLIT